jgi:glutathione S-transferase
VLRVGVKKIPSEIRESLKVLLNTLETFLTQSEWFAGDELTLADFALLASVESIKCWGANFTEYPRLNYWYERCRPLPGFTENHEGARKLAEKMSKLLDPEPLWK